MASEGPAMVEMGHHRNAIREEAIHECARWTATHSRSRTAARLDALLQVISDEVTAQARAAREQQAKEAHGDSIGTA